MTGNAWHLPQRELTLVFRAYGALMKNNLLDIERAAMGRRRKMRRTTLLRVVWALCFVVAGLFAQDAAGRSQKLASHSPSAAIAPEDVATAPADAESALAGLRMKVLHTGDGVEKPGGQDCVEVRFTAWRRDGSLQSTSGLHGETAVQCLPRTIAGVVGALKLMVTGERRRVWVPGNLTYLPEAPRHGEPAPEAEAQSNPDLTFDLELVRILKIPTAPDDLRRPPSAAARSLSGVVREVLVKGTGTTHPSASSRVSLDYSAWTAEGQLFETTVTSGHPGSFLVGSLLPGWREGLMGMVVGEKSRLWIPAALAYGEKPASRKLPAGNLVLDVQLLAID